MALKQLDDELATLRAAESYRETFCVEGPQGRAVTVDGRQLLCFCSNNYLGLATDPRVLSAAAEAVVRYGAGATASRLINGTMALHERLELRLAEFKRTEACLLFPTGYMANLGTIPALVGRSDVVIADRLSHASLIDGCRLSGASFRVYPHKDVGGLERVLARSRSARRRLIVTDSVFSMDGDIAPLCDIVGLARQYDAMTLVDEAHGTGVLGENGRGAAELLGVESGVDFSVGTLSKAFGTLGGFVAASRSAVEYLKNRARTFIYTTAPPPSVLGAALCSLDVVQSEPERRLHLLRLSLLIREQLRAATVPVPEGVTPIVPVIAGKNSRAVDLSGRLREAGFLVPAIRPPTVPEDTARLRISLQYGHSTEDVGRLADALVRLARPL